MDRNFRDAPVDPENKARDCAAAMYAADAASRDLAIDIEVIRPGAVEARMVIDGRMLNGHGRCHGGYLFTLADTAFAFACNAYDDVTVAAAASIEFLHPVLEGDALVAAAAERHRGRRTGVYDVEIRNQRDELVAMFRGRSHATGTRLLIDKEKPDT